MKYIILPIILASVMISCSIFRPNMLVRMSEAERETYLIELGKEVVLAFGPGYYREHMRPLISEVKIYDDEEYDGMRPEIRKSIGRKYYTVTFLYDRSKERSDWNYAAEVHVWPDTGEPIAAKVEIWQDTGEPLRVTFGNGYGYNFVIKSYKEVLRMPDRKVIPYQPVEPFPDIWNGERM